MKMKKFNDDAERLAGARATAEAIDLEVASGRPLTETLSAYEGGQRFWLEQARPFSKALSANRVGADWTFNTPMNANLKALAGN